MKILIVTNPELSCSIHCYAAMCTDDKRADVRAAFKALNLNESEDQVEEIAQNLLHGRNYWYNENYCFEEVAVAEA